MTWNIKEWLKPGSSKRAKRRQEDVRHQFTSKQQRKRWWHKWAKNYEGEEYDPADQHKNPEDVS